jgi:hypothetical protein
MDDPHVIIYNTLIQHYDPDFAEAVMYGHFLTGVDAALDFFTVNGQKDLVEKAEEYFYND